LGDGRAASDTGGYSGLVTRGGNDLVIAGIDVGADTSRKMPIIGRQITQDRSERSQALSVIGPIAPRRRCRTTRSPAAAFLLAALPGYVSNHVCGAGARFPTRA